MLYHADWLFLFIKMENLQWKPFYYNGIETNIIATKCGKVSRVFKDWSIKKFARDKYKFGEIDLDLLKDNKGYKRVKVLIKGELSKSLSIHLIIAGTFLNHKIGGHKLVIDHIDSNTFNNNVYNLRIVTQRENCSKEKTIKSGLPVGVHFNKRQKSFVSHIRINGTKVFLGYYKDIMSASNAYNNKLSQL